MEALPPAIPASRGRGGDLQAFADLVDALGGTSFFPMLHSALASVASFQNFIVLFFETGRTAEILHTNLDGWALRRQMTPYLNGLYELDPFFSAGARADERIFLVMDEIAPEEFTQTEFYQSYYTNIQLTQEARFIVPLRPARWIHVLAEREQPAPEFSQPERAALREVATLLCSLVRKHHELGTALGNPQPPNRILAVSLVDVLKQVRSSVLSSREVTIAESLLQGHSAKAIARNLEISLDTVANHKRHIYEKLSIHSQAQLFNLVLSELMSSPSNQ